MKLSVLEQVVQFENSNPKTELDNLVVLARKLDELGYHRLWLAEHHNTQTFLSSTPDLLMMHLLNHTKQIRLGSGGVMAMNYGSLQIAERFSLLATLFPNRVDLGLGRSISNNKVVNDALNQGIALDPHQLNQHIKEIVSFMRKDMEESNPFTSLTVSTTPCVIPEIYLLGSSGAGINIALQNKINYAYAQFFSANQEKHILQFFKDQSKSFNGKTLSCIAVFADESDELALQSALPYFYYHMHKYTGVFKTHLLESEKVEVLEYIQKQPQVFIGNFDKVATSIQSFAKSHCCDEIMMITYEQDINKKIKMYEKLISKVNHD